MVSAAIMGILALFMTTMMNFQTRSIAELTDKLAANELTRQITAMLQNPQQCSQIFAAATLQTGSSFQFDTSTIAQTPVTASLTNLPPLNLNLGGSASSLSPRLKIIKTQANGGTGLQVVFTGPSTATLNVYFDQANLVQQIHDLSFPNIQISTTPVNGSIVVANGCQNGTPPGSGIYSCFPVVSTTLATTPGHGQAPGDSFAISRSTMLCVRTDTGDLCTTSIGPHGIVTNCPTKLQGFPGGGPWTCVGNNSLGIYVSCVRADGKGCYISTLSPNTWLCN